MGERIAFPHLHWDRLNTCLSNRHDAFAMLVLFRQLHKIVRKHASISLVNMLSYEKKSKMKTVQVSIDERCQMMLIRSDFFCPMEACAWP